MQESTDDLRVHALQSLVTPKALMHALPLSPKAAHTVKLARDTASQIIQGHDQRLLVVVGPCSIHDEKAALEYACLLKEQALRFADTLFIVMRVYFEKPRTIVGWKGLISDPFLDGSFDINHGLRLARTLLRNLATLGLPSATEFLDTIIPQYLNDLIAWSAIGARTTESQTHRELASGLPMPVGFKNTTDGNIQIAIDAVNAASHPHCFLGISDEGIPSIMKTTGNKNCHIILRGGNTTPNYAPENIAQAADALRQANLTPRLMVDCNHGNSGKNYQRQRLVIESICAQLETGSSAICGVMLESNLVAGQQALEANQPLIYGKSITDACISWEETVDLLEHIALAQFRKSKNGHR